MIQRIMSGLRLFAGRPSEVTKPVAVAERLTVGQRNELFEVVSRNEIRVADGIRISRATNAQGHIALMLNNGLQGALVCVCPRGYSGACGAPTINGNLATCTADCTHTEVDLTHRCIFGYVQPAGASDFVLAPPGD